MRLWTACARWWRYPVSCKVIWLLRRIWLMFRTPVTGINRDELCHGIGSRWPQLSMKKPAGAFIWDLWIINSFGARITKMIRIRWWLSVPGEIFIWFDLPVPLGEGRGEA